MLKFAIVWSSVISAIGVIAYTIHIYALIGYTTGLVLGTCLAVTTIRNLAKSSRHSIILDELFKKITHYRVTIYNIERTPCNITLRVSGKDDSKSLSDVLQNQMGFPAVRVKNAIKHVTEIASDKTLEEKLRQALKYLDTQNSYKHITRESTNEI